MNIKIQRPNSRNQEGPYLASKAFDAPARVSSGNSSSGENASGMQANGGGFRRVVGADFPIISKEMAK